MMKPLLDDQDDAPQTEFLGYVVLTIYTLWSVCYQDMWDVPSSTYSFAKSCTIVLLAILIWLVSLSMPVT